MGGPGRTRTCDLRIMSLFQADPATRRNGLKPLRHKAFHLPSALVVSCRFATKRVLDASWLPRRGPSPPEDRGAVPIDLGEKLLALSGVGVVVAVESEVPIRPVERPHAAGLRVPEACDREARRIGANEVRCPRRPAFEDRDRSIGDVDRDNARRNELSLSRAVAASPERRVALARLSSRRRARLPTRAPGRPAPVRWGCVTRRGR